ncbi:alpha/beta hydrolase [Neisseria shayeganii]|uniref:Esterase/lipase/thioesterase n=1 Tax=Neisseria shayeganii 871 TaxID=1032488 RepID=G4CFG5_9NEIS|nr:alpha/beta hydrolase [Neisseria shayeganii]EGY53429.1 esterase/lipase/thioesterase [Neisseria shayeganii 871]
MLTPQNLLWIDGPAGKLQTIYLPAEGEVRGVAVVNHPNPLHGGTFTNKVIQTAAKAYAKLGFHCYLPNLRGVGESDGTHDYGRGETDDCVAVIDFARAQHPEAAKLLLSGFSFGGYVATFAAQQREPDALVLLGPAVGIYPVAAPAVPDVAKTLLVHGETDDVVPLQNALDWSAPQNLPLTVLPQASHFFHGKLIPLRDTLLRFVPALLAE